MLTLTSVINKKTCILSHSLKNDFFKFTDTEAGARKKLKKVVDGNPTTTDTERPRKRKAPSMFMMEVPIPEGETPVREVPHHAMQSSIVPHDTEVSGTSEDHSASGSTPGSPPGPVVHQEVFPDVQDFEDSSKENALAGMPHN